MTATESELRGRIVHLDYVVGKLNMDISHSELTPKKAEEIKLARQELQGAVDTMLMKLVESDLTDTNLIDMGDRSILIFPHPSGDFNHRQNVPFVGPKPIQTQNNGL